MRDNIADLLNKTVSYTGYLELWHENNTGDTDSIKDMLLTTIKIKPYLDLEGENDLRLVDHLWFRHYGRLLRGLKLERLMPLTGIGEVIKYQRRKDGTWDYGIKPKEGYDFQCWYKQVRCLREEMTTIYLNNKYNFGKKLIPYLIVTYDFYNLIIEKLEKEEFIYPFNLEMEEHYFTIKKTIADIKEKLTIICPKYLSNNLVVPEEYKRKVYKLKKKYELIERKIKKVNGFS